MAKPPLIGMPLIPTIHQQGYENYLPTAFDESMTLLQKVNKVIYTLNELGQLTNEMLERWNSVYQWVLNEGLEEAVKDKLEEWLKDGTLQGIIEDVINKITEDIEKFRKEMAAFLLEMEEMRNAIKESFHYEEIIVEPFTADNGSYYVTTIPPIDKNGKPIYLEKGYAMDDPSLTGKLETVRSYATRNKTSLSINASSWNVDTNLPRGRHMKNGEVHRDENDHPGWSLAYNRTTQLLSAFGTNVPLATIKAAGNTDVWSGFYPVIQGGKAVGSEVWSLTGNALEKHPRQVIGQLADKTVKVFTFRGREDDHAGYTYPEMQDVLLTYKLEFAYCLDGGGSMATVKSNLLINVPIDRNFGEERAVLDFISVKKPTVKGYEDIYKMLGDLSSTVRKLDARHISKYGDDIPSNLRFHNFLYLQIDKALYALDAKGLPSRMLGMYTDTSSTLSDGRIYFGNLDSPLSIQAFNNITVVLGNNDISYRINLTENSKWTDFPVQNGWTLNPQRELQYRKMNNYETRIRGSVVHGVGDKSGVGMKIGTLPSGHAPHTQMVIPIAVTSGPREPNNLIIYSNGDLVLQYPISSPNANTAVNIDCVINREA